MSSDIKGNIDGETETLERKGVGEKASISVKTWSTMFEDAVHEEKCPTGLVQLI